MQFDNPLRSSKMPRTMLLKTTQQERTVLAIVALLVFLGVIGSLIL